MRDLNRSSRTQSTGPSSGSTSTASRTNPAASGTAAAAEAPAGISHSHALRSDTLLQGRSHVNIVHNGETYQLRATKLGKLILTK